MKKVSSYLLNIEARNPVNILKLTHSALTILEYMVDNYKKDIKLLLPKLTGLEIKTFSDQDKIELQKKFIKAIKHNSDLNELSKLKKTKQEKVLTSFWELKKFLNIDNKTAASTIAVPKIHKKNLKFQDSRKTVDTFKEKTFDNVSKGQQIR